jgi:hypothetical protein
MAEEGAQCANDTSDDPEDSAVNDGCPAVGDLSEGARLPGACSGSDEGGCRLLTNPPAGSYNFTTMVTSLRDADGDGIDNVLDVCALIPNPGWNPRLPDTINDPDGDGLPNECDPGVSTAGPAPPAGCPGYPGHDEDRDCVPNRADNCPTVNQLLNPEAAPGEANPPSLTDSDYDGIGDACDPNSDLVNGANIGYCLRYDVNVGAGATASAGVLDSALAPECASLTFAGIPEPLPDQPPSSDPVPVANVDGGASAVLPAALPATGGDRGDTLPLVPLAGALAAAVVPGAWYASARMRRR